jgi:hypothetical protein
MDLTASEGVSNRVCTHHPHMHTHTNTHTHTLSLSLTHTHIIDTPIDLTIEKVIGLVSVFAYKGSGFRVLGVRV